MTSQTMVMALLACSIPDDRCDFFDISIGSLFLIAFVITFLDGELAFTGWSVGELDDLCKGDEDVVGKALYEYACEEGILPWFCLLELSKGLLC